MLWYRLEACFHGFVWAVAQGVANLLDRIVVAVGSAVFAVLCGFIWLSKRTGLLVMKVTQEANVDARDRPSHPWAIWERATFREFLGGVVIPTPADGPAPATPVSQPAPASFERVTAPSEGPQRIPIPVGESCRVPPKVSKVDTTQCSSALEGESCEECASPRSVRPRAASIRSVSPHTMSTRSNVNWSYAPIVSTLRPYFSSPPAWQEYPLIEKPAAQGLPPQYLYPYSGQMLPISYPLLREAYPSVPPHMLPTLAPRVRSPTTPRRPGGFPLSAATTFPLVTQPSSAENSSLTSSDDPATNLGHRRDDVPERRRTPQTRRYHVQMTESTRHPSEKYLTSGRRRSESGDKVFVTPKSSNTQRRRSARLNEN